MNLNDILDYKFCSLIEVLNEYFGKKKPTHLIDICELPLLLFCNEQRITKLKYDWDRDSDVYVEYESGGANDVSWTSDVIVISPKKIL